MSVENTLHERASSACELCSSKNDLTIYKVPPEPDNTSATAILVCQKCNEQILDPNKMETDHWRCLNDSMWNTEPAVQVVVWRLLDSLRSESWPIDLLEMMYMEETTKAWAKSMNVETAPDAIVHKDINGNILEAGDSVVLVKDLKVKGASFVAKQGTAVRRISLVADNPEHIEGKIEGQRIVILTQYVKKMK